MDRPSGAGTSTGAARVVAGRYRLVAPLGAGGMGTVWRAVDEVLGREVAVKEVVPPHGLSDADRAVLRERTRREARAAARLDHPSAVTVFDVVEEDGSPFLVMELVDARTLADVVKTDGPLTPRQAGEVGLAVLGALEAAHRQGIVHRDVKPGNVLLGADGRVVLTDFGIAHSSGDSSITSTGMLLGSPSYISPERARGQQPGPHSDLWSLGATLFTAVEGRPAYDAGEPLATVTAVVTGDHAPFRAAGPLEPVITGLLAREPRDRLDAETARAMLEQVVRDPAAERPPVPPGPTRPESRPGTSAIPLPSPPAAVAPAAGAPAVPLRPSRPVRPQGGRTRGPGAAVLVAALVFLLATVAGGVLLLGGGLPGDRAAAPSTEPSAEPSPDGVPSADPSGMPSPTASAAAGEVERPEGVPADWQPYTHPTQGWTLFHSDDYVVSERRGLTQFRDESTRYTLRVDYRETAGTSPLAAWQEYSPVLAQQLAEYQQLRLEPLEFRGWQAADLEFLYTSGGARLRVLDRIFVTGGRAYALYWQVAEDRFSESLEEFAALSQAFVPAP